MYLLSSVELLFALALNDALWFAYLALKSVAVSPTYFRWSSPLPDTRCLLRGIFLVMGTWYSSDNCIPSITRKMPLKRHRASGNGEDQRKGRKVRRTHSN